ncbi:MAG TPA: hypothetical protein VGP25_03460 [Gemmatimonadaceae bacterium]|jgi:hypothetical protein|nr:hypothetical protein [Gemmatimonadaceae bacterium]
MTIRELRILPPFAIGRLGSADRPLDNFSITSEQNQPLGYRRIVPGETLHVDEATGEINGRSVPASIEFKTAEGRIRPVAPFIELWARIDDAADFVPLTTDLLAKHGAKPSDVVWNVTVANRKVERRTGHAGDRVDATTGTFSDHAPRTLDGHSPHFLSRTHTIDFGSVRYIKPNAAHPEIRLRFMPAKGLIYGPKLTEQEIEEMREADPSVTNLFVVPEKQAVYDKTKGWWKFSIPPEVRNADPYFTTFYNETQPPALFAIIPPGPCWLNDNVAVSRGYLDDACDGTVEVSLTPKGGKTLKAVGRIVAAPPALVPDSLFVRTLADDLDQVIFGPAISPDEPDEVTRARAEDIVRRAFETVRFLNVAVMNGNPVNGRDPLDIDTMPAEEAFDVYRPMRPIFAPHSADTLAIMALHQRVYSAMRAGAAPWFPSLLRKPQEVADFTDGGRRKMPALMCGADGNYLALTHRQIRTMYKAAGRPLDIPDSDITLEPDVDPSRLIPRNASAAHPARRAAEMHFVAQGNPVSSRPVTSIGNCTPGLEVDFRAVWRRVFEGIVLREYDNLVMEVEHTKYKHLVGHRLLKVEYDRPSVRGAPERKSFVTMTTQIGPNPYDTATQSVVLSFQASPNGIAPMEWSNMLAFMLHDRAGETVTCFFSADDEQLGMTGWDETEQHIEMELQVRQFFEGDTGVISRTLAQPGELTQGLCSPWQNDYRECSCYYWASARPDFINVEAAPSGRSVGDNWLQKERTGEYVPDDYADSRLVLYDDLFNEWEKWLRFAIEGKDAAGEAGE